MAKYTQQYHKSNDNTDSGFASFCFDTSTDSNIIVVSSTFRPGLVTCISYSHYICALGSSGLPASFEVPSSNSSILTTAWGI